MTVMWEPGAPRIRQPEYRDVAPVKLPAAGGGTMGCPRYWDQAQYGSYRKANPTVGGGAFAVDTPTIRNGYYWLVLHASAHVEIFAGTFLLWLLCPEDGRATPPPPVLNGVSPTPQVTGIALHAPLGGDNIQPNQQTSNAQPMSLPEVPLIIPARFFLRVVTNNTNNTPAQNIVMEMRVAYVELALDDPGPNAFGG